MKGMVEGGEAEATLFQATALLLSLLCYEHPIIKFPSVCSKVSLHFQGMR